jgi:hypothetical protein
MPDFDLDLDPETLDAWLRVHSTRQQAPFIFSREMLHIAKQRGLDVDKLKADGVIKETGRIPT